MKRIRHVKDVAVYLAPMVEEALGVIEGGSRVFAGTVIFNER